jgi:hypothetical protein
MKKMMIAVFAVMAAVSAAGAEEIKIDFDGKKGFGPQSMHQIFAAGHQFVSPDGFKPTPAQAEEAVAAPGLWPSWLKPGYCVQVAVGADWLECRLSDEALAAFTLVEGKTSAEARIPSRTEAMALAKFYSGQETLKEAVASHIASRGDYPGYFGGLARAAKSKILYDKGAAYIISGESVIVVGGYSSGQAAAAQDLMQNKVGVVEVGIAVGLGCVFSDNCWEAIGNVLSDVAEELNSHDYNDPNDTSDQNCVSQSTC